MKGGARYLLLSFSTLTACAGPMTPFGAVNRWGGRGEVVANLKMKDISSRQKVRFVPERQNFHTSVPLMAIIDDPEGFPDRVKVTINYNGLDVSDQIPSSAYTLDDQHQQLTVSLGTLRLPAVREHRLTVSYQRSGDEEGVTATLAPPRCAFFDLDQTLRKVPEFDPPAILIRTINDSARKAHFNPNLIGGLIAQESGFDPEAVSSSKALGLTQVTALGEAEVIKTYANWPRYPGLDEMSWPILKVGVLRGHIHALNEWRLDPRKSIEGGINYLQQIKEYWRRPEKRALVKQHLPGERALGELILASYNSGPSRVSQVVERRGSDYLKDNELAEALNYVRRVTSYCDYYEHLDN